MTFEEVEAKFNYVYKQMEHFIPMGSKEEAERYKRKAIRFDQESLKKLKSSEDVIEEAKSTDEIPKEKIKEMMQLILIEEVYIEALQSNIRLLNGRFIKRDRGATGRSLGWEEAQLVIMTAKDKETFMLVEKDYPLRKGLTFVMICYKLQVENFSQMANDLVLKIYKIANSPRQQVYGRNVGNKMHKAFPLLVRKFPLPEGTSHCLNKNATARRKVMPLPEDCTASRPRIFNIPLPPTSGGVTDWHLEPRFIENQPDSLEAAPQSPIQTPPVPQDGDEREPMFIQPHDPDYIPGPMYPEYIPLEDEHILLAEEQPLPLVVSPTAELPEYVAESDPEEDPKEYENKETEDGPVDYPMDGEDDGDDNDNNSSRDDDDDEDEEEEEEEHLASADSTIVIPTDERVSPSEGAGPAEVERLLAMPTPSLSPLTSLSPPSTGERLARHSGWPPLRHLLMQLPSPPLPPPLYIPPHVDHRDDILEIEMPPRKSTLDDEARRRGIGEAGYGIRDTWVDPAETVPEIAPMIVGEVNTRVTELAELHGHDTQDLYALLEDAQDSRTRISQ
uniref:Uncharacterized protein n=1 Tax=Tanacetum cinerariifolium TaxID=118510 RepID=A0A6L2MNV8_TANCI|nr:hypothetical protein [Tanacetum cinerariifolium]